jgi:hypothetical protein
MFDGITMFQQNKGSPFLCGPVAQLGARFHGMEEVIGSIPIRSTNIPREVLSVLGTRKHNPKAIDPAELSPAPDSSN